MEKLLIQKQIENIAQYDVVVVGAGPAGICAAVSAARQGSYVALVERYGVIGGNLTIGHVGPILGEVGSNTMRDELVNLLGVPNNDELGVIGVGHDIEKTKRVLTNFVYEAGIETYLQSPVIDVICKDQIIKSLIVGGKEGMFGISGKIIIDATGDGDIASFAGCEIAIGREGDGLTQPVTLEFLLDGVDEQYAIACIGEVDDVEYDGQRFTDYTKKYCELGHLPDHLFSVRLHKTVAPGQRFVNTTQANGINSLNHKQIMEAEVVLRNQIDKVVQFLKKYVRGYENCRVVSSASTLGVRETRRVIGDYILTEQDLVSGRKFPDVIVHNACFIIDIHNPTGGGQSNGKEPNRTAPYDIPYRCFVPKKIDNLYTAGRCISGTHEAMASYRVMSICMAMGQAIGIAAALCAEEKIQPRQLKVNHLQRVLKDLGIPLIEEEDLSYE